MKDRQHQQSFPQWTLISTTEIYGWTKQKCSHVTGQIMPEKVNEN